MAHARRRLQGGPVSETCVRDAAEDLNQYGEKVGVNQLLGEYAIRILRDKPPDPVSYLIEEISKRPYNVKNLRWEERLLPGPSEGYGGAASAVLGLGCCVLFICRVSANLLPKSERGPGLAGSINTVARRAHRAEPR